MTAWVKGQATDPDAALAAAADLLRGARAPVVAGLAADVAAVQAAFRLARVLGASLDPAASDDLYADLGALAAAGTMATTPAEAVARADLVLVVGDRAAEAPLLADLAASGPSRGRAAGAGRSIVSLASGQGADFASGAAGLPAAIGLLRALVAGRIGGAAPLADLAARLRGARYAVLLYDPGEVGALGSEMLSGLAKDLNEATRAFALPVAGADQGRAVTQVAAWTTAQGPRVGFGRARPEHDPWRFDAARQARSGEIDAALWLAALPAPRPAWTAAVPTVALLGAPRGDEAEIVLAVGVPGQSHGGALWHPRRAAIAWHPAAAPGPAPSAAAVIGALHDRLAPAPPPVTLERSASC
ncbi:tungsten-containing formylmethanofuran dehydrogenase subunit B [Methylobacterium sp. WSM2598]|uniref:tungsten-containing formylmethanofuran dehydrogenase subunit B n=1 Tax=Methylobacterium sp. WSM2598 TaxID=398261 RepID=UPI0003742EE4|nr:tungsten-containing formylmethanofuran dehydrogenase subunit B [Methylobacterium sp. WSM2598]